MDVEPWAILAQYGGLGVILLLLISGRLHTQAAVERIERQAQERVADAQARATAAEAKLDAALAENTRLHGVVEERVVPALVRATDVQARLVEQTTRRLGGTDG